ncbi:hypothetical protein ABEB36_009195 [Hypothenemus hampei]|uniref:Uncharacterized protein n=1 Tax=Hypothenemus hampei TaxID=57062 RepID=A0ABD1ERM3_HYPHA
MCRTDGNISVKNMAERGNQNYQVEVAPPFMTNPSGNFFEHYHGYSPICKKGEPNQMSAIWRSRRIYKLVKKIKGY